MNTVAVRAAVLLSLTSLWACGPSDLAEPTLDTLSATATLTVAPASGSGLSLKVGNFVVSGVRSRCGALNYTVQDGQLDVGLPSWAVDAHVC